MARAFLLLVSIVLFLVGCGAPAEPSDTATAIPATPQRAFPTPTPQLPNEPVTFSRLKTEFGEPLSSGLSLPDMVENAIQSIVEIRAGNSGGTGFIVNDTGLVVTNKHVVQGAGSITLRLVNGDQYAATIAGENPTLDLAYLWTDEVADLVPIAVGDSDEARVGENVIIIGFPIADSLGSEPTVSQGIISAKRDGMLQTDAPINPGNSGGPMLDHLGNVIGVVVSRVEESGGRDISGIGFAIPINEVRLDLGGELIQGFALPTPTPFPTIGPTPDIDATKSALESVDAQLKLEAEATRTAVEAQQEAAQYAADLEATRIAELPTATPQPTPTPLPTATPHPSTYCSEWEAMVLAWISEGNVYSRFDDVPSHPNISTRQASRDCILAFPHGRLYGLQNSYRGTIGLDWMIGIRVGSGQGELLPGTYKYRAKSGDDRVETRNTRNSSNGCSLWVNYEFDLGTHGTNTPMPYGQPFEFTFHTYHEHVFLAGSSCGGYLYRIGG